MYCKTRLPKINKVFICLGRFILSTLGYSIFCENIWLFNHLNFQNLINSACFSFSKTVILSVMTVNTN